MSCQCKQYTVSESVEEIPFQWSGDPNAIMSVLSGEWGGAEIDLVRVYGSHEAVIHTFTESDPATGVSMVFGGHYKFDVRSATGTTDLVILVESYSF
jgi:hypothetical protein